MSRRPRHLAFTLVELLVVIGIIGILMAILLPTIRGARRQAYLAQCASNIRQLVHACHMHAQEHKGFLPLAGYIVGDPAIAINDFPASISDGQRQRYMYATAPGIIRQNVVPLPASLAPYLGVTDLPYDDWDKLDQVLNNRNIDGVWRRFTCPDTDAYDRGKYNSDPNDQNAMGQGTMMVCVAGFSASAWSTNSDYGFNEAVFGYHYDPRASHNRFGGNITRVTHSSEVALFTDMIPRKAPAFPDFPMGWICWTPTVNGVGPATLGDAFGNTGRVESSDSFDMPRHSKRMNVGYLDGHVETVHLTREDLDRIYLIPP